MQQAGIRIGRPGSLGCIIAMIPLLALLGTALVVSWLVGLFADLLLPAGAPPVIRLIVGVAALWLLLRVWRRLRARRRPPRSGPGGSIVIDV